MDRIQAGLAKGGCSITDFRASFASYRGKKDIIDSKEVSRELILVVLWNERGCTILM
jgi:hypothetical protein